MILAAHERNSFSNEIMRLCAAVVACTVAYLFCASACWAFAASFACLRVRERFLRRRARESWGVDISCSYSGAERARLSALAGRVL